MSLIDDAALLKMAETEILEDARRAAIRHSVAGISGWQPCPKPNKKFLANTILHIMTSNKILSTKENKSSRKRKSVNRKLIKKDEKINITYQAPKKKRKKCDVTRSKNDNTINSGRKCSNKIIKDNKNRE